MLTRDVMAGFYADLVTAKGGVRDTAIKAAFAETDRARFAGPGPWQVFTASGYIETPSDDPAFLYQDILVALAADRGINNGEPSLHARCLGAVQPKPGEQVLHIGAGTGYYTAILAALVGASGRVEAYEIEVDLAVTAATNLSSLANVAVRARSATEGDLPASDVIYVNAGATHPPALWLDALRLGGRLIFPLTTDQGPGAMILITRTGAQTYDAKVLSQVMFIPCIGARDEQASAALLAALMSGRHGAVRSLRRGTPPDDSSWLSGAAWWFSTRPN